jgi:teichuronic acid biosynthesis glycosyltransferase TuaG
MSHKNNTVSIITPTYNSQEFIKETIVSIINQTYDDWELLITDDCSSDNTVQIVEEYMKMDKRIKLFKLKENSGAGIARNKSIKEAKGRYISFCDSDDIWYSKKLQFQIQFLAKNNLSFTYSGYDIIDEKNNQLSSFMPSMDITYHDLLKRNQIGCLTAIYDTNKLGKLFMSEIRNRQDWVLWLIILKKIKKTKGLNLKLGSYRARKNSISQNKLKMVKFHWRVYYNELGYSALESLLLLVQYLWLYFFNKKNEVFNYRG